MAGQARAVPGSRQEVCRRWRPVIYLPARYIKPARVTHQARAVPGSAVLCDAVPGGAVLCGGSAELHGQFKVERCFFFSGSSLQDNYRQIIVERYIADKIPEFGHERFELVGSEPVSRRS